MDKGFEILQLRVEKLVNEGYNVAPLRQLLTSGASLPSIVAGFEQFDQQIDRMKELEQRYHELTAEHHLARDPDLERQFRTPSELAAVADRLTELEELNEMRNAMLPLYDKKLERWEHRDINVDSLREIMDQDLQTIKAEFEAFAEKVELLDAIRERIDDIAIPNEFLSDFMHLKAILDDPTKLSEIQFELMELEQKISIISREKAAFADQLEAYRKNGYCVDRLEQTLDQDVEVIRAVFEEFERDLDRLNDLQRLLKNIDTKGYEDQVELIEEMLWNPGKIYEIEERIRELAVFETERKTREKLRKRVTNWKWACLEVDPLEQLLDDEALPIGAVEEAFDSFEEQYQILLDLRQRLIELSPEAGFDEQINHVFEKLCDVDNIGEIEADLEQLEAHIHEAHKQREAQPGYDEENYRAEIEQLRQIEEQISRLDLENLQKKIKSLGTKRDADA